MCEKDQDMVYTELESTQISEIEIEEKYVTPFFVERYINKYDNNLHPISIYTYDLGGTRETIFVYPQKFTIIVGLEPSIKDQITPDQLTSVIEKHFEDILAMKKRLYGYHVAWKPFMRNGKMLSKLILSFWY